MAYGKPHCYAVKIEKLEATIEQQRAEIEALTNALPEPFDSIGRLQAKRDVLVSVKEITLKSAPPEDEI